MFLLGETMVCNLDPLENVANIVRKATKNKYSPDIMCLCSHEQYSFPRYFAYQPTHFEKLAVAARTITEEGYQSIWHTDGLYGNTAWG